MCLKFKIKELPEEGLLPQEGLLMYKKLIEEEGYFVHREVD